MRVQLIEAAARVLAEEGPHAVTTRRVASEVGTSTTAIYSLLGGKEEMFRAMFLEGFTRLAERQHALEPSDDPIADLRAIGRTYFENGVTNPHLYEVMFHRPVADFVPEPDDIAFAYSTLHHLVDAVQRAIDAGVVRGNARDVATELWALAHGVTSLTIAGMIDRASADDHLERLMRAAIDGYRA